MRVFGRKLERRGAHHSHSLLTRPDQKKTVTKTNTKTKAMTKTNTFRVFGRKLESRGADHSHSLLIATIVIGYWNNH